MLCVDELDRCLKEYTPKGGGFYHRALNGVKESTANISYQPCC